MSRPRGTYNIEIKSLTSKPQWKMEIKVTDHWTEVWIENLWNCLLLWFFPKLMLSEAAELACSAEFLKTVTE